MSSFIHVESPAIHRGIVRAENFIGRLVAARRRLDSARGLAVLLLSAIIASMLVVADRVMSTTAEGGLLVAWIALWAVAFVGLALCAGTARALALRALASVREGARRRAEARADQKFMASARHDPRVMSEMTAIATRRQAETQSA